MCPPPSFFGKRCELRKGHVEPLFAHALASSEKALRGLETARALAQAATGVGGVWPAGASTVLASPGRPGAAPGKTVSNPNPNRGNGPSPASSKGL